MRFDNIQIFRVSGKKQDGDKQNNGWLCSTDFQRVNINYEIKILKHYKTKTNITTRLISPSPYCLLIQKVEGENKACIILLIQNPSSFIDIHPTCII